jgi:hypothetical protein
MLRSDLGVAASEKVIGVSTPGVGAGAVGAAKEVGAVKTEATIGVAETVGFKGANDDEECG